MIRDQRLWRQWEVTFQANDPPDFLRNLSLFQSMMEEAVRLGRFPPEDPLEGLEVDLRVAQAVNLV